MSDIPTLTPIPFSSGETFMILDEIPEEMTYDQWHEGLKIFKWASRDLKGKMAKYLAWGIVKFGKARVDSSLEQLEFDLQMVSQAISINTVPDKLRRPGLTGEHYLVIAKGCDGKMKEMKKWSEAASAHQLTPGQLKASIHAGRVVSGAADANRDNCGLSSVHATRMEFDLWLRKVGGIKGVLEMDAASRDVVLRELKEIAEFYNELMIQLEIPVDGVLNK